MKEFLILRHGEPLLFGLALTGPTWVNRLVFERPIEKLGGGLELFWDGELIDWDKAHITGVIAHWKKRLNRRAKNSELPLPDIVDMEPLTKEEREEFLFSVNRGDKSPELTILKHEDGYAGKLFIRLFNRPKLILIESFPTKQELMRFMRARLVKEGLDPAHVGVYEYHSRLAWLLHERTDAEARELLELAHFNFQHS